MAKAPAVRFTARAALTAGILLWSAVALAAEPPLLANDPKRPADKIAHDLGVRPEQFVACFNDVKPAPAGTRPTQERVHANKAVLLGCLQRANPTITNDGLDSVMDRHRPGGREAQTPQR